MFLWSSATVDAKQSDPQVAIHVTRFKMAVDIAPYLLKLIFL